MSDTPHDKLWRTMQAHGVGWIDNGTPDAHCYCGHRPDRLGASWHAHVATAILALPGIAVVELPELMANREEVPQSIRHQSMWEQRYAWATIQDDDGLIYFENGSGVAYGTVNPAEARDLAAALLAAADYAERDQ